MLLAKLSSVWLGEGCQCFSGRAIEKASGGALPMQEAKHAEDITMAIK
jgi:hypothetical protein